ncbi:MAG: hypothetical protein WBQ23_07110 [Bacteroidota bacterium]
MDPTNLLWYGVDLTTTGQWGAIDDLHCNWLQLSVNGVSGDASEQMLEHPGYKYIVDRVGAAVSPYSECDISYIGASHPRKAVSCWLAKYVMGSFAVRLHPESAFDFDVRDDDHGVPEPVAGATRTSYESAAADPNAIHSVTPKTAEPVRDGLIVGKEFWPIVQTHAEKIMLTRFPYPEEIKANIGIGLSYGAKGIVEHLVMGVDGYEGLVGPTTFPHRDKTADTVAVLNERLRGAIGTRFLDLLWERTYEGGFDNISELQAITLTNAGNAQCSGISTSATGGGSVEATFVQVAKLIRAGAEDYLFLVNKRTQLSGGGDRFIDLTFGNAQSLFFQDVESHAIEVIPVNGTKTTKLTAGEFCLLRTGGNSLTSPLTVDNVMHVRENAVFTISSTSTIENGAIIHIEDGATLRVENGGSIMLNGGSIVCEATGRIQLVNPQGIIGSGTITTPQIELASELIIPDGSTLTLTGGGSIGFIQGTPSSNDNRLSVFGELRFRGTVNTFTFGTEFDEFFIYEFGIIDIEGELTLAGLPHINNWNQGQLRVRGLGETERVHLIMRDRAELNSSSILDMEYAEITTATDADEWDGIIVVSPEALCRLQYVDILHVFCDPVSQGTGIHFYEAANSENLISHCNIIRSDKSDKLGDGIFLQPGGTGSYATIECTTTGDDWWTGVTTVSSPLDIIGLTSSENLRGLGAHLSGTIIEMQQSILDFNAFQGFYSEQSILYMGEYRAGYNAIRQNGNSQIELKQFSHIYRSNAVSGTQNDIGHSSNLIPRIVADSTSTAEVQSNCWLTATPVQYMFVEVTPNSIIWNPFLSQSAVAAFEDWTCERVLTKSRYPVLSGNPTRATLKDFARAGRMNDVYTFIESGIAQSSNSATRVGLLRDLMNMELIHIRDYPDSTNASRTRLMSYLTRRQPLISPGMAAEMVELRAEYFTFSGYPDSADVQYDQLERYYGTTPAYRNSLHSRLSNAFIKRDSIAIDDAISAMLSAALDSGSIRLARAERRAYYRCRKSNMIPKRTHHEIEYLPTGSSIEMFVHPNPWTSSSVLTMNLPEDMAIRVKLLTLEGRELGTLTDGFRQKGQLTIPMNPGTLPAGVYLCLLESVRYSGLARVVILR